MAYLSIENFKFGMDRRRERVAGTPGTLWTLENGHITRGGDIENCKKFVPTYTLPAGTHGCFSLNRQLYAFGSSDLAASMPVGVAYQRLQSPNSGAMTQVVDVYGFAGEIYVIADFDDGGRYHFYNGSRLTDWDAIAAAAADYSSLAKFLSDKIGADGAITAKATDTLIEVTANVAGTPFTLTGAHANGGSNTDETITVTTTQANVAPVAEIRATATITVLGGTNGTVDAIILGGVQLNGRAVQWNATDAATAERIAQQVNGSASTTGYSASVVNNVVTITAAPGTGAMPNGTELEVDTSGDILVSADAELAGGVTAVAAVAQVCTVAFGGTFEADDLFTLTLNGTAYRATGLASGTGSSLYVDYQRVWSPVGSLWRYCKLADATVWDPTADGSDAGFIDVAADAEGAQYIVCARRYSTFAAVYCENVTVLYTLDTDPANFAKYMVLDNTSTDAPLSPIRYGNNDVFHLDPSGIRSLRALNYSNAPFVSDVGNAIDTFVLDYLATLPEAQRRAAVSVIEPRDGRFWLAVGGYIIVLSFFPGAKISAWSYYTPGFTVDAFARSQRQLYVRSGDTIYLYGGPNGDTDPDDNELVTTVELPFLSAGTSGTKKGIDGFDAAFVNEWDVSYLIDPNREDKLMRAGVVKSNTYQTGDIALDGQASMVAMNFTCKRGGRRVISMAQLHFDKEEEG